MDVRAGRAAALVTNWRLLLMLIAFGVMALVVVSVIGFSGAYYTSQSTSPDNAFSAGSVDLRLAVTGQVVDGAGFAPGETRSGSQTVTNMAHRAEVTLSASGLAPTDPLGTVVNVVVRQTSPSVADPIWSGVLVNLQDVSLGQFASAEARTFEIELAWPANVNPPLLEGAETSFEFEWLASSAS